jgi:dolichol-phosphate mannosyltransferase
MLKKRWLAALPVYNEAGSVHSVLDEVSKYASRILVVNDGSTDATRDRLAERSGIQVVTHDRNRGYGAALKSAFRYAIEEGYELVVTLDCDGQHQPQRIPRFVSACEHADIVSGSRYLKEYADDDPAPPQRLFINKRITRQINERLGLSLTDAFCGFKAYRTSALQLLDIEDEGYAMPLELWVQAAMRGLRIIEIPVPRLYLDLNRSFGGTLDQAEVRLAYYNDILNKSIRAMNRRGFHLPSDCREGAVVCCGDCV